MKNFEPLYCFGDMHVGVERSGGTTPSTRQGLKAHMLEAYGQLLQRSHGSLIINGDWLDTDKIDLKDLLVCYKLTSAWLAKNNKLYAIQGNHCASGNVDKTSSFDLLCGLLQSVHGDKVVAVYETAYLPEHDAYVVASVQNQDRFDKALAEVPKCTTIFLHCNYANKFAEKSLHSLNMTEAQAKALPVERIVISHEHNSRKMLNGKVHLIGCPQPSSVSDCLNSPEKFMVKVTGAEVEYISTWQADGDYAEQDWRELSDGPRFIRVTGQASAAEAAAVVSAISRFRSKSEALVITNAVSIEGVGDQAELQLSLENIKSFDVKSALFALLDEDEVQTIETLLKKVPNAV